MPFYSGTRYPLRRPTPDLLRGLVAHWKLDEASGTRNDSYGANHLTDNNTVTQAVGVLGNAAQFTRANSETLSIADNAALSMGDIDFTLGGWVRWDSFVVTYDGLFVKWNGVSGDEYAVYLDAGVNRITFGVDGGGGLVGVTANALGAPTTGVWYGVLAWHDSIGNTINIQVNNGVIDTAAHSAGVRDSNSIFRLGEISTNYFDGRMDGVFVAKRLWSPEERAYWFNNGLGREFPWR